MTLKVLAFPELIHSGRIGWDAAALQGKHTQTIISCSVLGHLTSEAVQGRAEITLKQTGRRRQGGTHTIHFILFVRFLQDACRDRPRSGFTVTIRAKTDMKHKKQIFTQVLSAYFPT